MEVAVTLLVVAVVFMALWVRAIHAELLVVRSFAVAVASFTLTDARKSDPRLDLLMNNLERAELDVNRRRGEASMN